MGGIRHSFSHDGITPSALMPSLLRLKSALNFSPETGVFTWKVRRGKVDAGTVAGSIRTDGYLALKFDGRSIRLHRLAWAFYYGSEPPVLIDHLNRDKTDNRIANLRGATHQQNSLNRAGRACGTDVSSGGTISRNPKDKNRWRARLWDCGKERSKRADTFCGAYKALCEMRAAQ